MPALTAIDQVGVKKDIKDLVYNVDQKGTPLIAMIQKNPKLTNLLFQWQVDSFDPVDLDTHLDGKDLADSDFGSNMNRVMLSGRLQQRVKGFRVSPAAQDVSEVAGVKDEFGLSIQKAIANFKRSLEAGFLSDLDSVQGTSSNADRTRGLGSWISNSQQSDLPVPSDYLTPASSIYSGKKSEFTQQSLQDLLTSIWNVRGVKTDFILMCGSTLKTMISDFANHVPNAPTGLTTVKSFNQNSADRKIIDIIEIFEGNFGNLEIIANPFIGYNGNGDDAEEFNRLHRGYIFHPDDIHMRTRGQPEFVKNEDKGGGKRGFIRDFTGLEIRNPQSLAKIAPTDA